MNFVDAAKAGESTATEQTQRLKQQGSNRYSIYLLKKVLNFVTFTFQTRSSSWLNILKCLT